MPHLLLISLYLAQAVHGQGTSDDVAIPTFPSSLVSRSIWDLLAACALTLLICIWQAIHPSVPRSPEKWYYSAWWKVSKVLLALYSFLLPEWTVYVAYNERCKARDKTREFGGRGYEWTMTHSFFAEMGGFAYCDRSCDDTKRRINSEEFARLRSEKRIANPEVKKEDIEALSKSDTLGKIILAVQLIWFMIQVAVRYFNKLAITLVELDTVCMALLTLLLLYIWHNKPLRPDLPYTFYSVDYPSDLSDSRKQESALPVHTDDEPTPPPLLKRLNEIIKVDNNGLVALCATWIIFGGLHLAAWNYPFLTDFERISWRLASFILTVAPAAIFLAKIFTSILRFCCAEIVINLIERTVLTLALLVALVAREILVLLMFASLRSLHPTALETVSWTSYIPHLYVGIQAFPAVFEHVA